MVCIWQRQCCLYCALRSHFAAPPFISPCRVQGFVPPPPPTVTFAQAAVTTKEEYELVSLPVQLSGPSDVPTTVAYYAVPGTALGGGVDYYLANGTLTFAPGETSKVRGAGAAAQGRWLSAYGEALQRTADSPACPRALFATHWRECTCLIKSVDGLHCRWSLRALCARSHLSHASPCPHPKARCKPSILHLSTHFPFLRMPAAHPHRRTSTLSSLMTSSTRARR